MKKEKPHFKLPEGYLADFTDQMMDRIAKESSVIPKTDGFKTPDDYLDEFKAIIPKVATADNVKVIPLRNRRWYVAAIAVAALVLVFLGIRLQFFSKAQNTLDFNAIASAEIEAYFETNEIGLTAYEIAEEFPIDELPVSAILKEDLQQDELLEYLGDTIEDIEYLNLDDDE